MNYNANVGARHRKYFFRVFPSDITYTVGTVMSTFIAASRKPKRVSDVNAMGYPQGAYQPQSSYVNGSEIPAAASPYGGGRLT